MKLNKLTINLGDNTKMVTSPSLDFILTESNGDNILIWKKEAPEFITALFGAYIDDAKSEDVASLVKGIRRKLDIRKSKDIK